MNSNTKIALITGANRGIGLETASQLATQDVFVIVSARNSEKLRETKLTFGKEHPEADFVQLDVTDMASIQMAREYVETKYGRLDILINNAGIAEEMSKPPINNSADISIDSIKQIYATNVFGVIAVTQAMLPLLRKSANGRIVNLSSGLGSLSRHSDVSSPFYHLKTLAYNSSKAALNQFTIHLSEALHNTQIKVNSVSPGWVKTDLGGPYAPLQVADGAKIIVKAAMLPDEGPTGTFFTQDMAVIPW